MALVKKTKPTAKVVTISEELHAALKAKAVLEGRVLQRVVEDKLRELLEPEQRELMAAGALAV